MKIEKILKKSGFKKKWTEDKSGYWWELKLCKKMRLIADLDMNFYYLDIRIYKLDGGVWKKSTFETCRYFISLKEMLLWLSQR